MTLTFDDRTHEYRWDGRVVPSVTQVLKGSGFIDDQWFTEDARMRGSAVHLAIELLEEGALDWSTVDERILPHLAAYEAFRREMNFRPILVEEKGYHPIYGYAGRPDCPGVLNGKLAVVDLKTGARQNWMGLQLAAYAELLEYLPAYSETLERFEDIPKQKPERYVLELNGSGRYRLHRYNDREDFKTFLAALHCLNWRQRRGISCPEVGMNNNSHSAYQQAV